MNFIGNIKNLDILKNLPSVPQDGEVAYLEDTSSFVIYDEDWKPAQISQTGLMELSLYDLNKSIILKNGKVLTDVEIANIINDFGNTDMECYYLLLNKEISHYTVFDTFKDYHHTKFGDCVVDIINSFGGRIYDAEKKEDKIELWVKIKDEMYCFFLFPYGDCVIEVDE